MLIKLLITEVGVGVGKKVGIECGWELRVDLGYIRSLVRLCSNHRDICSGALRLLRKKFKPSTRSVTIGL